MKLLSLIAALAMCVSSTVFAADGGAADEHAQATTEGTPAPKPAMAKMNRKGKKAAAAAATTTPPTDENAAGAEHAQKQHGH